MPGRWGSGSSRNIFIDSTRTSKSARLGARARSKLTRCGPGKSTSLSMRVTSIHSWEEATSGLTASGSWLTTAPLSETAENTSGLTTESEAVNCTVGESSG